MNVIARSPSGVFGHKKYYPRALESNCVVWCGIHKLRIYGVSTRDACQRFLDKHGYDCICEQLTAE